MGVEKAAVHRYFCRQGERHGRSDASRRHAVSASGARICIVTRLRDERKLLDVFHVPVGVTERRHRGCTQRDEVFRTLVQMERRTRDVDGRAEEIRFKRRAREKPNAFQSLWHIWGATGERSKMAFSSASWRVAFVCSE